MTPWSNSTTYSFAISLPSFPKFLGKCLLLFILIHKTLILCPLDILAWAYNCPKQPLFDLLYTPRHKSLWLWISRSFSELNRMSLQEYLKRKNLFSPYWSFAQNFNVFLCFEWNWLRKIVLNVAIFLLLQYQNSMIEEDINQPISGYMSPDNCSTDQNMRRCLCDLGCIFVLNLSIPRFATIIEGHDMRKNEDISFLKIHIGTFPQLRSNYNGAAIL